MKPVECHGKKKKIKKIYLGALQSTARGVGDIPKISAPHLLAYSKHEKATVAL